MNAKPHSDGDEPLAAFSAPNLRLRVGDHVVDMGTLRVISRPDNLRLTGKAADVLLELARNSGNTVSREHLLDTVWTGRITTPDVVTQAVKELRRAFIDDTRPARYIETIPRKGYRLVAPVLPLATTAPAPVPLPLADRPEPISHPPTAVAETSLSAESRGTATRRGHGPTRSAASIALIALIVVVGVITIAVVQMGPSHQAPAATESHWRATDLRSLTSAPGAELRPSISPDGTRVAYVKRDVSSGYDRIVVRSTSGQSKEVWLTTRAYAHEETPTWSPDGTQIAFERLGKHEECTLHAAPSMGGADREIGPCGNFIVNYFDWTPNGRGLITSGTPHDGPDNGLALTILDVATGKRTPLRYRRNASNQDVQAMYSPDGRTVVFRRGLSPHSDLFLTGPSGGNVRQLTHLSAHIVGYTWAPDSKSVIVATNPNGINELFAIDISSGKMRALGVSSATYPDAASHGNLVVHEIQRTKHHLAEIVPEGKPQTPKLLAASTGNDAAPAFSGDGRHIAFVSNRGGDQQLWICSADGSNALPLTDFRDAVIWNPVWSKDASRILISVRQNGSSRLVEVDVASHREHRVAADQSELLTGTYGPQPDSYLAIREKSDANGQLVLIRHADQADQTTKTVTTNVSDFQYDPESGYVYYAKSNIPGIYRVPLPGGNEEFLTRRVNTTITGSWRIIDRHLWYVSGMLMNPFDVREYDPATGKDTVLAHVNGELLDVNFSVSPERDRILITPMGPVDVDIGIFKLTRSPKS